MTDAELNAILRELYEARMATAIPLIRPDPMQMLTRHIPALVIEVRRLREERAEILEARDERLERYEEDVAATNAALDAAGLHVGSSDLSTLVAQLIGDADNGREAYRGARSAALEEAAEVAAELLSQEIMNGRVVARIVAAIRTLEKMSTQKSNWAAPLTAERDFERARWLECARMYAEERQRRQQLEQELALTRKNVKP